MDLSHLTPEAVSQIILETTVFGIILSAIAAGIVFAVLLHRRSKAIRYEMIRRKSQRLCLAFQNGNPSPRFRCRKCQFRDACKKDVNETVEVSLFRRISRDDS